MATTTFTPSQLRGINSSFPYKNYGLWAPEISAGAAGETKFVMEVTIPSDSYLITLPMNSGGVGTNYNLFRQACTKLQDHHLQSASS